jgi:transcriptional regulator with XRE-family HTH domain
MFERNRIAETLRSARQKQGLSLEQAATAAGIPLQYLRLLEGESNVQIGVSDELYLIPFFRRYARFFGIDAEELLPEFLGVVQQIPGEGSPPIRLTYRPRWGFLWKPAAVLLTIAVAVALMLRQAPERPTFDEGDAGDPGPAARLSATSATEPAPAITPVAGFDVAPTTEPPTTVPTPEPSPSATPGIRVTGDHELKISAVEEAWLSLAVDDQPAKQYLLRPDETRSWTAQRFSLTVGNAGGIRLTMDGKEMPPIGLPGRVVRNLRLPEGATPVASPSAAAR